MNKQDAIKGIKDEEILGLTTYEDEAYNKGLDVAVSYVNAINEPEMSVIPQDVADWLEVCKENLGFGLATAMSHSTSAMQKQPSKVQGWFNLKANQEAFAKAWLYGYEIEEKLYTVSLKKSGIGIGIQQQDGSFKEQFTKDELKEHGFDNLDEYEIEEVKE